MLASLARAKGILSVSVHDTMADETFGHGPQGRREIGKGYEINMGALAYGVAFSQEPRHSLRSTRHVLEYVRKHCWLSITILYYIAKQYCTVSLDPAVSAPLQCNQTRGSATAPRIRDKCMPETGDRWGRGSHCAPHTDHDSA